MYEHIQQFTRGHTEQPSNGGLSALDGFPRKASTIVQTMPELSAARTPDTDTLTLKAKSICPVLPGTGGFTHNVTRMLSETGEMGHHEGKLSSKDALEHLEGAEQYGAEDAAMTDSSMTTQGSASPQSSASTSSPSGISLTSPGSGVDAASSPETEFTSHEIQSTSPETDSVSPETIQETKRKKLVRTCYTNEQIQILMKMFHENPYPDSEQMEDMAKEFGVPDNKIKIWFQNKRARWRRRVNNSMNSYTAGLVPRTPAMSPVHPYSYMTPGHMVVTSSPQHVASGYFNPWIQKSSISPNNNRSAQFPVNPAQPRLSPTPTTLKSASLSNMAYPSIQQFIRGHTEQPSNGGLSALDGFPRKASTIVQTMPELSAARTPDTDTLTLKAKSICPVLPGTGSFTHNVTRMLSETGEMGHREGKLSSKDALEHLEGAEQYGAEDATMTDSSMTTQGSAFPQSSASTSSPSGISFTSPGSGVDAASSPETEFTSHEIQSTSPETDSVSPETIQETKRKKLVRTCYTNEQIQILMKMFHENPYPDSEQMEDMAKEFGVPDNKIKIWFQNKRARWRRRVNNSMNSYTAGLVPRTPAMSPVHPYSYMTPGHMVVTSSPQHVASGYINPWFQKSSISPNNNRSAQFPVNPTQPRLSPTPTTLKSASLSNMAYPSVTMTPGTVSPFPSDPTLYPIRTSPHQEMASQLPSVSPNNNSYLSSTNLSYPRTSPHQIQQFIRGHTEQPSNGGLSALDGFPRKASTIVQTMPELSAARTPDTDTLTLKAKSIYPVLPGTGSFTHNVTRMLSETGEMGHREEKLSSKDALEHLEGAEQYGAEDAAMTDSSMTTPGSASPQSSASTSSPSGISFTSPGSGVDAASSPETEFTSHEIQSTSPETDSVSPETIQETKRKKLVRTCYTNEQIQILMKMFHENPYPDSEQMEDMAKEFGVPDNKIKIWFQNKRARWRRRVNNSMNSYTAGLVPRTPAMSPVHPYSYMTPGHMVVTSSPQHVAYGYFNPWIQKSSISPNNNRSAQFPVNPAQPRLSPTPTTLKSASLSNMAYPSVTMTPGTVSPFPSDPTLYPIRTSPHQEMASQLPS
ncbi:PITX3-like protein [Mya arenaria]|uniref:PITX3-like protein n=1 Tax=Mya arenaria TaxID=6604 RepID=A0ABY7DIT0_MYAAR|nr:PITX3-like protein [Mya arenaria]